MKKPPVSLCRRLLTYQDEMPEALERYVVFSDFIGAAGRCGGTRSRRAARRLKAVVARGSAVAARLGLAACGGVAAA